MISDYLFFFPNVLSKYIKNVSKSTYSSKLPRMYSFKGNSVLILLVFIMINTPYPNTLHPAANVVQKVRRKKKYANMISTIIDALNV